MTAEEFFHYYHPFKIVQYKGMYSFMPRKPSLRLICDTFNLNRNWKSRYFFLEGDGWMCHEYDQEFKVTVMVLMLTKKNPWRLLPVTLRVTRSWRKRLKILLLSSRRFFFFTFKFLAFCFFWENCTYFLPSTQDVNICPFCILLLINFIYLSLILDFACMYFLLCFFIIFWLYPFCNTSVYFGLWFLWVDSWGEPILVNLDNYKLLVWMVSFRLWTLSDISIPPCNEFIPFWWM